MNDHNRGLYDILSDINRRPRVFEGYTAKTLWDDDHISERMLAYHLNEDAEPASRPRDFIDRSAAWIADRFSLASGTRVIDFGCGPGLYTSRFAETGADVVGIDFSRRSIAHARNEAEQRGLDIEYLLGDYLEFQPTRRFDLATLIYCDLCPLSREKRQVLLRIIRDALEDDGALLLDVFTLDAYDGRHEEVSYQRRLMGGFWSPGDYWGFKNTLKYDEAKVVLDKYTIVEPARTRLVHNWLQYYSLQTLSAEFERSGMRIVEQYSDVAGSVVNKGGDIIAVVARKT